MSIEAGEQPDRVKIIRGILLTALCCCLPALSTGFDWLRTFIPLAPFCFCVLMGQETGRKITLFGFLVAVAFSIAVGNSGNIIYPLTLLPVGIGMALTAEWQYSPAKAGFTTTVLILLGWVISGLLYYSTTGNNSYNEGLQAMDQAYLSLTEMYKSSSDIPEDVARDVVKGIESMRQATPAFFPSLLIATAIFTSWINMVLGNRIIRNSGSGIKVWPVFKYWRISENLIWVLIVAGVSYLIPLASIKIIGLNLLLVMGIIYFFQGVAVLLALLDRFKTPRPIRFLIYVLLVVQTYSVFMITLFGIIDVWKDLGKIYSQPEED